MAVAVGIPGLTSHWYYNTESGELTNGNNLENLANNLVGGLGWHELNISGSATEAQAAAEAKKEFPTGTAPTTSIKTGTSNAVSQELTGSATGLAGLSQIGAFFSTLVQAATWERIAEVLLGTILIAVGVAHMTKAVPIATAIASKVP
jgi:hypothetical protein